MIPSLGIDELKRKVARQYENDEKRIVGIMLARYEIEQVREIINNSYLYWHESTENNFDIYWAGYGEYLPVDNRAKDKILMTFDGNENKRVYYDRKAFISIKREINDAMKKRNYKDYLQLVLVNFHDGKLWFEESFKIDFEQNEISICETMEWIIETCSRESNVADVCRKYNFEKIKKVAREIKISDVISLGLSLVGNGKKSDKIGI